MKHKITDDFATEELRKACEAASADVVGQAATQAAEMYITEPLVNPTPADEDFSKREEETFRKLAYRLREPWLPLFFVAILRTLGRERGDPIRFVVHEPPPEGE